MYLVRISAEGVQSLYRDASDEGIVLEGKIKLTSRFKEVSG